MLKKIIACSLVATSLAQPTSTRPYKNEVWTREQELAAGIVKLNDYTDPLPHTYLATETLPSNFTWCDKDGVNYCTMSRNQHVPQYCGSCWAHGAISALGDRIKIKRGAKGIDINLSVQHMLNCGNVGSCYGGSVPGPYSWIKSISRTGAGISYETSQPYMACSSDSNEGFCSHASWGCNNVNKARTCSTFTSNGGACVGLGHYPNATVTQYGTVSGADRMAAEIYARGPITCGVDAMPILDYDGSIISERGSSVDHVISVVGWGSDGDRQYWIARNSWGEYWGHMGYFYVEKGNNALLMEEQCAWAVPGEFTETGLFCGEDGSKCRRAPHVDTW